MTANPLAGLLLADRGTRPIAFSAGQSIVLSHLRADVASVVARLVAMDCRSGLIGCDSAYWATVGMFALAHAGAQAVFPPNLLPSTITALSGAFDCILTDGPIQGADLVLTTALGDASTIAPMDVEQACIALFTSGSSGAPKRVVKTFRQLELEAETVERVLGQEVPAAAGVHATVAHHHLYGLTFRLCWPIATGRPFFSNAHQFWEPLLADLRSGDVLVTTPSHLSRLGGLPSLPPERRPSAVLSGGAPLPDSAADAARTLLGCSVREIFGSTEAGVIGSRLRCGGEQPPWQPMPGVAVARLADGRMHVRSPYILNPEHGLSGDIVELNDAGGFRLLGRADRIAKIEGVRVSLSEVDSALIKLQGVAQAAVVVLGECSPYLGAVVVPDEEGEKELAAAGAFRFGRRLRRDLSTRLSAATLPRRWRFVQRMPTGPIGKASASDLAGLFNDANVKGQEK